MAEPAKEQTIDSREERIEQSKLSCTTNVVSESSAQSVTGSFEQPAEETQPESSTAHPPESRTDNMTDNTSKPSEKTSTENTEDTKAMTLSEMVSVVFGPAPMPTGDSEKELWSDSIPEPAAAPTAQTTSENTTGNTEKSSTTTAGTSKSEGKTDPVSSHATASAVKFFTESGIVFPTKPTVEHQNQSESSENDLFQLESVMDWISYDELSEEDMSFLNALNLGVRSPTEQAAVEAARKLDSLCPPPKEEEECNNWLWGMWCMMLGVAGSPDVTVEIQDRLICIILALREIAKGELKVCCRHMRLWTDLPGLSCVMETFINDPTTNFDRFSPISVQAWEKETYFAAQLMANCIYSDTMEAIAAFREALEEERDMGPLFAACRIRVACIWLTHAGKRFLRWALDNAKRDDVPEDERPAWLRGGSLYHGPGMMCLQRWGFWIERLENLEPIIDEGTRQVALDTAETMREVEKRMGNLLSS